MFSQKYKIHVIGIGSSIFWYNSTIFKNYRGWNRLELITEIFKSQ